jgi:serine/threonine-protein kinase
MYLDPGQIVAGKYEIERVLGRGGMGTVISAVHMHLRERVAIKILSREAAEQTEATSRFMREARAAARIRSEHVAKVSDVGTLPDGTPYIVMEYLDGFDLADTLAQRGPLPPDEALELVLQACEALAEAHSLGIVHRDLKPANLFLTHRADGTPCIKVLDFGISKMTQPGTSQAEAALTHTTTIMGSPLYMSPEQIRATRGVDLRTDIWSLGVIIYELLTGQAPFTGQTLPDISVKIAIEPPPPLRSKRPEVSALLEAVVLKCLEKDRENRFRTLAEFALALLELAPPRARLSIDRVCGVLNAAGLPTSFVPPGGASPLNHVRADSRSTGGARAVTGDSTAETVSTFGSTASERKSKRALFAIAGIGVLAVGALAAYLVLGRGHADEAVATPAPAVEIAAPAAPKVDAENLVAAPIVSVVEPSPSPSLGVPAPATARPPSAGGHPSRPRPGKSEPPPLPSASPPPPQASAPAAPSGPPPNWLDSRK